MYKTSEQRRQWRCHSCPSHTHHYYTLYLSDVHRISILLSRQSLLSMYCVCAMVGRSALVGLWLQNVCVATETCPKKKTVCRHPQCYSIHPSQNVYIFVKYNEQYDDDHACGLRHNTVCTIIVLLVFWLSLYYSLEKFTKHTRNWDTKHWA